MTDVLRYTAFSDQPYGGNPAGVVLDASELDATAMQAIAAGLGYSESAFITTPIGPDRTASIRYFAPEGEIPFCGHATVATAAALADHGWSGTFTLETLAGPVIIEVIPTDENHGPLGSFVSPPTGHEKLSPEHTTTLLNILGWGPDTLHPDYPPGVGAAGNRHPVLVLRELSAIGRLDYDFPALQALCRDQRWVTIQLVVPLDEGRWRSRNPFPYGGVHEDPATGSAAAALTGYLRHHERIRPGDTLVIDQGIEMGRPSRITVTALADRARIAGSAAKIK